MKGHRKWGESPGKRERDQGKKFGQSKKGSGVPGTRPKKARPPSQWVEFKHVGSGWQPDLTLEAFNRLKRFGKAEISGYSFVKDHVSSGEECLVFEAMVGTGLTSKFRKHLGLFAIDLKKMGIYLGFESVFKPFLRKMEI